MTSNETTPQEQLILSAKRLERLLSSNHDSKTNGTSTSASTTTMAEKKSVVEVATTMIHSNPCKIVKRWLSTSSGLSGKLSLADVSLVAQKLLNPIGTSASGRDILVQLSPPVEQMQTEGDDSDKKQDESILVAASREVEAYLFSLAIRILWAEGEASALQQALDLSVKAIQIVSLYIEESEASPHGITGIGVGSATGLFPLLARLYRYQGLVSETVNSNGGTSMLGPRREQLVHSHRIAVTRRDVDTQATLLNLILRELLNADQGELYSVMTCGKYDKNMTKTSLI